MRMELRERGEICARQQISSQNFGFKQVGHLNMSQPDLRRDFGKARDMETEIGLDRADPLAQFGGEKRTIQLSNHEAAGDVTEIATVAVTIRISTIPEHGGREIATCVDGAQGCGAAGFIIRADLPRAYGRQFADRRQIRADEWRADLQAAPERKSNRVTILQ